MRLPPFQQGGLDSLCGLYGIVNADRIINGSDDKASQALFNEIVRWLTKRGWFTKAVLEGLNSARMTRLMKAVQRFEVSTPWVGVTTPTLDEFWKSMHDFAGERKAIMLSLGGYNDHWTVIKDVSNFSIWLYDSDHIKRLARHDCTTVKNRRRHVLYPAQTYYLEAA